MKENIPTWLQEIIEYVKQEGGNRLDPKKG